MSASYDIIPAARIRPHQSNVRRDLGDLAELAASIKGMGVLQPLTVAPDGDDYVVIAGHRRLAAAQEAGLEAVPCIVRDDLDSQAKVIEAMLVENLQRSDLTAMEEGDAYAQLELLGVKDAAICKATGRAPKTVKERRLLASLPTQRREQFENGRLSLEGAVKCARLREKWADDAEILTLIDAASTWKFGNDSWGSVEHEIKRVIEGRKPKPEPTNDAEESGDDEDDDQFTVDRQIRDEARSAELERLQAMWTRQAKWFSDQFEQRATIEDIQTLAVAALKSALRDGGYDLDTDAAATAGIVIETDEQTGERSADFSTDDALLYCVLAATQADVASTWASWSLYAGNVRSRLRWLMDVGYELSEDEAALIEEASDGE